MMESGVSAPLPVMPVDLLAALRVLDLTTGAGRLTGRLLADLGADVLRVDAPTTSAADGAISAADALDDAHRLVFDAGKRRARLDPSTEAGSAALTGLVRSVGLLLEDGRPGDLAAAGLTEDTLRALNPRLVVVSLSAFGQDGPYRDWIGTERVQLALSSVLSRSGLPGLPPLLPPGELATQSAAVQAAWAAVVAWYHADATGTGDRVDLSVLEATLSTLDAAFGVGGSAAGGLPAVDGPRGRPDARHMYPIFPCADGAVRICLLAPRQWRGMRAWLGEPAEFADPRLEQLGARFAAAGTLYPYIGARFATHTRDELVAAGDQYGFPIAPVLDPADVLEADHFRATGALTDIPVDGHGTLSVPGGLVEIDGRRTGLRAPAVSDATDPPTSDLAASDLAASDEAASGPAAQGSADGARTSGAASGTLSAPRRPLAGIRVLDLGVIVVGAETGRLLADQGAEVIKVESTAFPDGARQSLVPGPISPGFSYGHRGKLSIGLDLRSDEGARIFRDLVAVSDVVLSNFKPGTMESLGFSHDELAAINPGIITAQSSAFGSHGPWSGRMGYGPLVRAVTGLTSLWAYPERPAGWSDATTIYPDHIAARVGAVGVLAALARRRRTGRGASIQVSQADVILGQAAPAFARESLRPGSLRCVGNVGETDAPQGLYPCAGDDEWLVIDVHGDDQWRRLAGLLQPARADQAGGEDPRFATAADRLANRAAIEELVLAWTSRRSPRDAMTVLQEAGVPAAAMLRVPELLDDPHLRARGYLAIQPQPQIDGDLWAEVRHAHFRAVPDPELRPAPLRFEHTRDIAARVLGLDDAEIDRLVAAGVLEVPARVPAAVD